MGDEGLISQKIAAKTDFVGVYELYAQKIFDYHYFRTLHRQTAEDLTSLTFTKAFEHFKTYDARKGSILTWIYRIARNTLIDHYRTRKPIDEIDDNWDLSDKTDLESELDNKQKLEKVREVISGLPSKHRDLLMMRIWDGLSFKEISKISGRTETSLKVAASRLMAMIRSRNFIAMFLTIIFFK
jgi:RNA polymerase sigma-70 factor (ECF subfamily)